MMEILDKLLDNGIAVLVLVVLIYLIYVVGKWLAPRVDAIVNAHVAMVESTGENIVKQTALIEDITNRQDYHSDLLTETDITVNRIAKEMGIDVEDDSDPEIVKERVAKILKRRKTRKAKLSESDIDLDLEE